MQLSGSTTIHAPVQTVWDALHDPDILRRCLPGCESVERDGADAFKIVIAAAVGPLRARFNGKLTVTQARPPLGCVLVFEGQGGAMGFGKGSSEVTLQPVPQGTALGYAAKAQVGGKLAQVGARLVDGVAQKMSEDFFRALREALADAPAAGLAVGSADPQAAAPRAGPSARWLALAASLGAGAALGGAWLLR